MSKRQPDWDLDRLRGEEAEAFVREVRERMLTGTVEVKRDDRATQTGNFYIEYEASTANGWQPSGIAATKANDWAFVCWPFIVTAPTWMVKLVARRAAREGFKRECGSGSHPTKGVVVPLDSFLVWLAEAANDPLDERAAA